jgi:dTMP kinase
VKEGLFVVLEGIDGSGTTTQAARLADHLRADNRQVHVTREPSTGPIGAQIRLMLTRRIPLADARQAETMALLFAADRLDHLASEVEPRLRAGFVVISDRYDLSSLAYQSVSAGSRHDITSWIRSCNQHARRPDLTVVVDVSPEVAAARRASRGGDAELYEEADLQARLAKAYLRAEDLVPGDRVAHVDGDAGPDAVARAITAALAPLL